MTRTPRIGTRCTFAGSHARLATGSTVEVVEPPVGHWRNGCFGLVWVRKVVRRGIAFAHLVHKHELDKAGETGGLT